MKNFSRNLLFKSFLFIISISLIASNCDKNSEDEILKGEDEIFSGTWSGTMTIAGRYATQVTLKIYSGSKSNFEGTCTFNNGTTSNTFNVEGSYKASSFEFREVNGGGYYRGNSSDGVSILGTWVPLVGSPITLLLKKVE